MDWSPRFLRCCSCGRWTAPELARRVRDELQALLARRRGEAGRLHWLLEAAQAHELWRHLEDARGHPFDSFERFCVAAPPHGLGYDPAAVAAILEERRDLRVQARQARPLRRHGQHGARRPPSGQDPERIKGGTGRAYWLAKLARDRPDLLRQVERGAIASAREAAVQAGWTTRLVWCRLTGESFARQALKHLPAGELAALLGYLQAPDTLTHAQRRAGRPGAARPIAAAVA